MSIKIIRFKLTIDNNSNSILIKLTNSISIELKNSNCEIS